MSAASSFCSLCNIPTDGRTTLGTTGDRPRFPVCAWCADAFERYTCEGPAPSKGRCPGCMRVRPEFQHGLCVACFMEAFPVSRGPLAHLGMRAHAE